MEDLTPNRWMRAPSGTPGKQVMVDTQAFTPLLATQQEGGPATEAGDLVSCPSVPVMEPREIASSPTQPVTGLKRALSPAAAASSSQESKRVRAEGPAADCFHCGCSSHRWTACITECLHCGQRHIGARCPTLLVENYTPGGFRPNEHYHPPGEDLPALKLTPVDTAVPTYKVIEGERAPAPDTKPAVPHFGEAHAVREGGPDAVITSIEPHIFTPEVCDSKAPPGTGIRAVQSTPSPDQATATTSLTATEASQPQALVSNYQSIAQDNNMPTQAVVQPQPATATTSNNHSTTTDDEKMNAGRAALIAVTSDTDFQASAPLLHEPDLGPTSSGANEVPLGEKKPSDAPVPVKAELESQPARSWRTRQDNLPKSKPSAPQPRAPAGGFPTVTHWNAAAIDRAAAEQGRKAAADGRVAAAKGRNAAANGRAAAAQGRVAAANGRIAAENGRATAAANAANASMKITNNFTAKAPSGPANSTRTSTTAAAPTLAYGQTLFGNSNGSTATNSNPASASTQTSAQMLTAADHAKKDNVVWSKVVQQIKDGVNKTCRAGKPFNGINSRERTHQKVAEALKILRPLILGSTQNVSNVNGGLAPQATAPANTPPMQLPGGGAPTQPPPQPMLFQFHQGGTPPQPPPHPPQGKMVWDWAAGTWEWKWH